MAIIDHFDLIAPFYERFIRMLKIEKLIELLKLPAKGRMLDAGGGTGRVSSRLRSMVDEVVVSDLSHPMLKQAQMKNHIKNRTKNGLLTVQAHAERLPFPDESFERVLVVDALHHFCDQQKAIHDLLRVLKPGGRIVIEEPDVDRFIVKIVALAEKIVFMRSRFLSSNKIMTIFQEEGLSARVENDGRFIFWVVVDK